MVPLAPERTPDLSGVRVWIAGGKHDTLISPEETQQLANTLQAAGAEVVLRLFETGHGLTNVEIVFAQRWLTGARPEA
jgi:predicted esterase